MLVSVMGVRAKLWQLLLSDHPTELHLRAGQVSHAGWKGHRLVVRSCAARAEQGAAWLSTVVQHGLFTFLPVAFASLRIAFCFTKTLSLSFPHLYRNKVYSEPVDSA